MRPPTKAKRRKPRRERPARPNRLHVLRTQLGLTLHDVFKLTGATQAAISRWENGQGEPQEKFRAKYAAALGITGRELGAVFYDPE